MQPDQLNNLIQINACQVLQLEDSIAYHRAGKNPLIQQIRRNVNRDQIPEDQRSAVEQMMQLADSGQTPLTTNVSTFEPRFNREGNLNGLTSRGKPLAEAELDLKRLTKELTGLIRLREPELGDTRAEQVTQKMLDDIARGNKESHGFARRKIAMEMN